MKKLAITLSLILLAGCAAKSVKPEAQSVELVNEAPDESRCKFVGEVVGSQGNWLTGEYTSNKNLVVGARNELRNEAYALGGNVVYVQEMKDSKAWKANGTTNTTAVGKVYRCQR